MNRTDLYHPYVNKQGKLVSGPAALNHYIYTVKGGIQEYNNEVGIEYVMEFVREHSDIINEGLARKAQKDRFHIVS